jgi:hypothetical protein
VKFRQLVDLHRDDGVANGISARAFLTGALARAIAGFLLDVVGVELAKVFVFELVGTVGWFDERFLAIFVRLQRKPFVWFARGLLGADEVQSFGLLHLGDAIGQTLNGALVVSVNGVLVETHLLRGD